MKNKNYFTTIAMLALVMSMGAATPVRAELDLNATTDAETTLPVVSSKESYKTEAETKRMQLKAEMRLNQDSLQKEREESRVELQNKKAELKGEIEKKRNNQIEQIKERAVKKITAAITRMENMQTRLESRIAKLDVKKVDTAQAKTSLAISKQKLADAKTAIESVKSIVTTADMKTADKVKAVKEAAKKVEVLLKESHKALVEAIVSLKADKDATQLETKTSTEEKVQ